MRLTEEQRALAGSPEAMRVAAYWTRRYARRAPQHADDIRSAAHFGLVLAAAAFDPVKGKRFATFADHRVRGEVLDVVRDSPPKGFRRGRGGPPPEVASLSAGRDRLVSGDLPVGWEVESEDAVLAMCRGLPGDGRAVATYYLAAGSTLKAIADAAGVTKARAGQVVAAGVAKLRANQTRGES